MKVKTIIGWFISASAVATLISPISLAASPSEKDKPYTGIIKDVNGIERTITVKGLVRERRFELGDHCAITLWDSSSGVIQSLHPGQKITVSYVNDHGVLAADDVRQMPMRCSGVVSEVDPQNHQLVFSSKWDHSKRFFLADNCSVILHDQRKGALANIQPGDHVTVLYETPSGEAVARQVEQPSDRFTGAIVAVDVPNRTITAKSAFGTKQFTLAKNCSIVMNGKLDAPLMDVRLGDRLTIDFDEVNGVDVANRVGPAEPAPRNNTAALVNP